MNLNPQLIILLIGLIFVALGIAALTGWWKKWYWRTRGGAYGYIPMGLLFVIYAYEAQVAQYIGAAGVITAYVVLAVLVVYLSLRPPRWIKPNWIRWVEDLPAAMQKAMRAVAKEDDDWMTHMNTQEAVKKWAKQLKK